MNDGDLTNAHERPRCISLVAIVTIGRGEVVQLHWASTARDCDSLAPVYFRECYNIKTSKEDRVDFVPAKI